MLNCPAHRKMALFDSQGRWTAYAFSLGAVQRRFKFSYGIQIELNLSQRDGVYYVFTLENGVRTKLDTFRTLAEARRFLAL